MANCNNTLLIRHFSPSLTMVDKEDFLKHFGAVSVRLMAEQGRMKNCAFATFDNHDEAKKVMSYLHQLEILGSKLTVEFAKDFYAKLYPKLSTLESKTKEKEEEKIQVKQNSFEDISRVKMREFYTKLNAIAPKFGLEYTPSPNLYYIYPTPNVQILTNIAHALATVPKFYVQVLHLMNKMNLPAPFGPITPAPPVPDEPKDPISMKNVEMEVVSGEEESELESDEDNERQLNISNYTQGNEVGATKRPSTNKYSMKLKKPKLQQLILHQLKPSNPSSIPIKKTSEIFDIADNLGQRKIEFKIGGTSNVDNPELDYLDTQPIVESGGFGKFKPQETTGTANEDDNEAEDLLSIGKFISLKQLEKNRISSSEMKRIPAFKNYEPGEPTTRLYLKNLSKQATEKDLTYIYGRYVDQNSELEKTMFDVQLLKGRMKEQAFITLPNQYKAKKAVEETNGYLLLDKPIVVLFARSARPKEPVQKRFIND